MRQITLTALIVLLGVGNTSADGIGWDSGGTGSHGFFDYGHFGHGYYHHDDGEDDGENGSDENGSHDGGWHDGGWHDGGWHTDGHGFIGHGWHGGYGFFGHGWHGGYGWGHSYGWDPKERIEAKFSDLMEIYETGVAEIEDFFESDEYDEVIDGMEWLIAKHDWYLEHAEHKADRLCDVISRLEDKLLSYQEGWDEHRWDHLPGSWQEWIEERHTAKEDWLIQAVDSLAEKKSNLEDTLNMHMSLNDDLNGYLDEILSAGGVTELVAEALAANEFVTVASSTPSLALLSANSGMVVSGVPEPTAAVLATLGLMGVGVGLSGRRGSRRT